MKKTFIALLTTLLAFSSCIISGPDRVYYEGDSDIHDRINYLDIDWQYGAIIVRYWDRDYISFYEEDSYGRNIERPLRWAVYNKTLKIEYASSTFRYNQAKKLYLNIPEGLVLSDVDIQTTNADVDIDTDAKYIDIDTTNGSVVFSTTYRNTRDIEIGTISGDVELFLPIDANFDCDFDTVSGQLNSEFSLYPVNGDEYRYGSGYTDIEVDTVSGNLTLTIFR